MSATLNQNQVRYVPWKGIPKVYISSIVSKNGLLKSDIPITNVLRKTILPKGSTARIDTKSGAQPLRLYRRELVLNTTNVNPHKNHRTSIRIDELNRPNGYLVNSDCNDKKGAITYGDLSEPNSMYENGANKLCLNRNACIVDNARRRVRSSGIIRKTRTENGEKESYFTNTNQYLVNRNRTFAQNQYTLVRYGEPSLLNTNVYTGSYDKYNINVFVKNNVFSTNNTSQSTKYTISTEYDANGNPRPYNSPQNNSNYLQYNWIDGLTYEIHFPYGDYSTEEFNSAFTESMIANRHYYTNLSTNSKIFLMKFVYNTMQCKIEFQSFDSTPYRTNTATYRVEWSTGYASGQTLPQVVILDNVIKSAVGFTPGSYPPNINATGDYAVLSNSSIGLYPSYSPVLYKPNNPKFSQQGAVSSSALVSRLKYDTVTSNAKSYEGPYGKNVANALSYSVSENINQYKAKLGYPLKKTPIFRNLRDGFVCNTYKTC
jgi:hypothetical protein